MMQSQILPNRENTTLYTDIELHASVWRDTAILIIHLDAFITNVHFAFNKINKKQTKLQLSVQLSQMSVTNLTKKRHVQECQNHNLLFCLPVADPSAVCFPVKRSQCYDNPAQRTMSSRLAGPQRWNADHEMPVSFGRDKTSTLPATDTSMFSNPHERPQNNTRWGFLKIKYCLFKVDINMKIDMLE